MLNFYANQLKRPKGLLGRVVSRLMINGNSHAYSVLIPELEIGKNERILEIGYGPGAGINRILSGYDCFVTGIDFSELMYREAVARNKKHIENKKAELFHSDFLTHEMIPDQFDKIFCINVVYFWMNPCEPFSKIRKGLKKGGMFCLYMETPDGLGKYPFTHNDIFNKYTIEQVVECLKSVGFIDINYKTVRGYSIKCRK